VSDISFATPEIAFVVADGDVYRSDDGGATWVESFSIYRAIQSIAISPGFAADQTIFAVDGGSRLFRSTDGGGAWEEVTRIAQIGGASDEEVWLSISPAFPADPTLWASSIGNAYRSTDGGLTWELFDSSTLDALNYRTAEWSPLPAGLLHRPTILVKSDATLLLGTMRGLYRSTDGGATWAEANAGLPRSAVGLVTIASDGTIYGGGSGDPRLFRLQADGTRWEPLGLLPELENGVGTVSVRDMAVVGSAGAPPVLVITTYDGLFVSRDGGATWDRMEGAGLPGVDFSYPLPLLSANFAQDQTVHMAFRGRVYRSDDGGDSWVMVEGVSDVVKLIEAPHQRLIGLAPRAVYEWDPALGGEWTRYPADFGERTPTVLKLLSARFVTDLLAVAIVGGDVYLSEDGGRAWTVAGQCIFGRLPYLISPRFDTDHAIYAFDGAVAYVSTDTGRTWVEAGEGLPTCEYDSPECGFELLCAERSDGGYTMYASVRHDFHTRIWGARTIAR